MNPRKTVLITGGAGSLGRAFVRLLEPDHDLIVVDSSEWAVAELKSSYRSVVCHVGDFADYPLSGMEDVIIHCAAYKHVDLGESHPASYVRNNLTKTADLYEKVRMGITRLLYVSTDKAVEPVSAYGATKMLAERMTWEIGGQVARLGNILDSSGSVLPLWEKAILEKRPIPLTDPAMTRWMLDVDGAARQIWNGFNEGRRLIVPDMGQPVRLPDLMAKVLLAHGYAKGSDYLPGVEVIGARPGEKLHEKLLWDHEISKGL